MVLSDISGELEEFRKYTLEELKKLHECIKEQRYLKKGAALSKIEELSFKIVNY